jgi:ADP-heptose:LPS heptosyltransferase
VLTTPVIRAIRRARPAARLSYLVEPQAAPVVAGNPNLDAVIVSPLLRGAARLREDARMALLLRRARFDAAIDFHGGPRSSLLALASGARERVGYTITGRSWMYTTRVPRPRGHRRRHSVENQWDLAEALIPDLGRPTRERDPVEMREEAGTAGRVERRLQGLGIAPSDHLIVVHVGAGNEFRRWPAPSFAEVAAGLTSGRRNRRIILTTGPAQAPYADEVRRLAIERGAAAGAISVACDVGLDELRGLVARARLFLGGDSGPAHIAATTATPMVVLFGPTTQAVWGPWRREGACTATVDAGELPCRPCDQRVCEPGDFRCLRRISPEAVMAAADRVMRPGAAPGADSL